MKQVLLFFAVVIPLVGPMQVRAAGPGQAIAQPGANAADCARANSDYERSELGRPVDPLRGDPLDRGEPDTD